MKAWGLGARTSLRRWGWEGCAELLGVGLVVVWVVCVASGPAARSAAPLTHHLPIPVPAWDLPSVGVTTVDPAFGTTWVRVTDARALGWPGAAPMYSKRQAWNADESRMLVRLGDGRFALFDGRTFDFLRILDGVVGEDVFWHPTRTDVVLYNPGNELRRRELGTGADERLVAFSEFDFADTRSEGNLSRDGRFYAVVGIRYDPVRQTTEPVALVLADLVERRHVARLELPKGLAEFDWVSVSPSGRFVVVDYATTKEGPFQGLEVYDAAFRLVWRKPLGSGHSDLGYDAQAEEVLVMGIYDPEANRMRLGSHRLSDGQETPLLELPWFVYYHVSCRADALAGWCLVSTYDGEGRLEDSDGTWGPFENEVFLLDVTNPGQVRRLAHHRSRRFSPTTPDGDRSVYWAEPHATISPSGTAVLFGSNWGRRVAELESVDAFVLRLGAGSGAGVRLAIRRESPAVLVVEWSEEGEPSRLQVTDPVAFPWGWRDLPGEPERDGTWRRTRIAPEATARFFRLQAP